MNATHTYPQVRSVVNWSGAIYSGIVAGTVFFFVQIFLLWAFGAGNPWEFPQRIAAVVLGPEILLTPATSELPMMSTAAVVLLCLALLYAAVLAVLLNAARSAQGAILIGLAFGLMLYLFNFHVATLIWPWLAESRHGVTILSHAVFGILCAWIYRRSTV